MSDLNTAAATVAPTATVAPAKPGKSKGLTLFNRLAFIIAALLALMTAIMLLLTVQASRSAVNMRDEAAATLKQAGEEFAPYWCSQITPENVKKFDDLHTELVTMDSEIQGAVKEQCYKKTVINDLVASNSPGEAFDTSTNECTINGPSTTITCSVTVKASEDMKNGLAMLSSATVTLDMTVRTTNNALTSKGHKIDNVATLTVDSNGNGSTLFTIPYDPTWGEYYKISATSFYPNE